MTASSRVTTEVCRLAAWLGTTVRVEELIMVPEHSLIDQSQAATESKIAVNGDGYGFAWYAEDGRLGVYRDVLPAWGDGNLTSLASMISAPLILAHVRASTFGAVARSNCHPFVHGNWSFMHNGQIAQFGQYRRKLEAELCDDLYALRIGNTDSELLFLLLLQFGLEKDVTNACGQMLELLARVTGDCRKPSRITAVFSNGQQLYALRTSTDNKSPTLYAKRAANNGLVLASEPLDKCPSSWRSVEEGSLFVADSATETVERIAA